ncbi:hypothetical protein [Apibacter sp. HY039]|uniref:hypothetical protein n=1 Tax=Apibacter sp. HY039 TaxID=2501476 RepID=UPI000FEB7881|nr:hypothetical protein [Apibacter sp. HY039]
MTSKITKIIITDADNTVGSKLIEIINSFENNSLVPTWFRLKLENLKDDDLWENEYLMKYDVWVNKMLDKKWKLKDIQVRDFSIQIDLELFGKSNYSELLSIISILGIDLNNVLVEDSYFGNYTP